MIQRRCPIKPLTAKERFTALQSGEVDMLSRTTTWTMQRDSSLGLVFAGIMYYDGQGFMVNKKLNVKSAKELNGASVCVATGTTTERNLADYFRANKLTYKPVVYEKADEIIAAYQAGRCDVYTTDQSSLYTPAHAHAEPGRPRHPAGDHLQGAARAACAPRRLPVVHASSSGSISRCSTPRNSASRRRTSMEMASDSKNPEIMRALGNDGDFGPGIGLTKDWVVRIVKHVGNYGEMYERTLGEGSPIKIARGYNNLWSQGGLQYAPPIQ